MALRTRKPIPDTPLVVCLSRGGILRVKGVPYTFRFMEKVRRDHPLVKAYPAMFAEDGLTTAEYEAAAHLYRVSHEAAA